MIKGRVGSNNDEVGGRGWERNWFVFKGSE